uniref:Uncharacterized protein n=1 Tax=Arundo donax TaxID=35708 RepID=A0A0A8XV52_ARUDO
MIIHYVLLLFVFFQFIHSTNSSTTMR